MKHLLFGSKSVFVGDEAADVLVDYAAHVAQVKSGARVDLLGYSMEGARITTTFLLNGGTTLVAETTDLPIDELDNAGAITWMRERIQQFSGLPEFVAGYTLAFGRDPA